MAFQRYETPELVAQADIIVLLDRSALGGDWCEVEEFPDTPEGQREAEAMMYSKESTTGFAYRIVRRVTREEVLLNWT